MEEWLDCLNHIMVRVDHVNKRDIKAIKVQQQVNQTYVKLLQLNLCR
jgi:hypothetical protein